MPLHDWTRVNSGLFHHFHQGWCWQISRALNRGRLPKDLAALVEQWSGHQEPVLDRPQTRIVRQADGEHYAGKASRVVLRHRLGRIVAFIEIVSPGNKDSTPAIDQFVEKIAAALRQGVHVLVADPFPPTPRDPHGIHKAIWDRLHVEDFDLAADHNRTLASYEANGVYSAFIETIGVGDPLPDMPLFIAPGVHVRVPLESTYMAAWQDTPDAVRELVG